ncbi:anti-sigma factor domain-containing protein [Bacillus sp. S3]|uniref:anti-sigma factor domain-containing protein n=1 Tax=Bacillus sp. S3 TaxID=486398 RepID=UPI001188C08C|nr:anti-sigma factor domain-containing protein [Bacillus sp. S3]QCJ41849.1 anti-sigma factor domain-containing protein [Bacillus sp. S3]
MKKGIIMQIDEAHLTMLTPEGEFFRTRKQKQDYVIGEEIHFFPIENVKASNTLASLKNLLTFKSLWAVMAALLIFLGSFIPMYQNNRAYAYMSIDANPSIELGVNKKMQVVELVGFNKEGKKVISELKDWKKKDISELTKSILVEMETAGFIKKDEQVIISTVRNDEPDVKVEKDLQKNINEIKAAVNKQNVDLTVLTATEKEREKAQELGISTGKYQENKNQSSQKGKIKTNENKQEHLASPPENPGSSTAPGQLKKQVDGIENNNGLPEGEVNSKGNVNPPGQLKKADEEQWKRNDGQINKQFQPNGQQNNGQQNKWEQNQKEKDSNERNKWNQKEINPNQGNKWKQQDKMESNPNKQKQWNQKDHKK